MACDLACKTKIILNGGNTANMLNELCYQVKELPEGEQITTGDELIKLLNQMEELAGDAQALYLKGIGYDGPLPRGLVKPGKP